jgi:two-component system response regulator NreC
MFIDHNTGDHLELSMSTRVLLADDHQMLREGLAALLSKDHFDVVGQATDGLEAVELAQQYQPDVAVLDLSMPRMNGVDASREISKVSPATKTVLLTMYTEDRYVLEALRAGIKGYVMKTHSAEDLGQAIEQVSQGGVYLSPGLSDLVVQAYFNKTQSPEDVLTARERQVVQLIAEGNSNKHIAAILGLSVKTVESHRMRIMQKLDIHDSVRLVHYAVRHGLVRI